MKSRILLLAAILAVFVVGHPTSYAENFYSISSVTSSTAADDFYPAIRLIQGAGVGYDANSPHDALGVTADFLWVTAAPGGGSADYIEVAGTPIITLDLGLNVDLDEISTWGYSDTNANGVSEFSLRFATDADGPSGFGTSITFNPTYTMDFPATPRQSNLFGQIVNARYVEFTALDNFFGVDPPNLPGGDRVGLGEVAFRAASPQQLLLEIDRVTGNFTLSNPTLDQNPIFSAYDLTSAVGGMDPTEWLSIAENYDADSGPPFFDPVNNWLEFGTAPDDIAEGTLGTVAFGPGMSVDLGNMWIKNPNEDVVAEVLLEDGTVLNPLVQFVGNNDMSYELADLNFDNAINALDWPIYRDGYRQDLSGLSGAEGYQRGDLNFDGQNNAVDFGLFKTAYDAVNGAGSFDRMLAGVPEPATGALLLFGVAALAMSRLRRDGRAIAMLVCGVAIVQAAAQPASAVIVAHWDFENPADLGNDIVGGHDQVAAGADVTATAGRVGAGAVSLDGTGTGIEVVRDDGVVNFGTMTTMSVAAFVNPTGTSGLQRVFGAYGFGGGTNDGWGMGLLNANMRYTTYGVQDYDQPASYVANEWQHFAVVIDEGDATFYQDGSNIGTITGSNPTFTSNPYHIGISAVGALEPFIGDIDDLRVYDNALTDSEVFDLASIGTPNLSLQVNTISGNVSIINDNTELGVAVDFDIDLYEIVSPGGQLLPGGWDSIQDNGQNGLPQGDGTGNGWEELGTPSVNFLGEAYLDGSSLIADQDEINLGTAFDTSSIGGGSGTGDLEFSFRLSSGTLRTGLVEYVDIGFFEADFNRDGSVDGDDFLAWQTGFGTQSGAEKMDGDYDNDEDVDGDDFLGWQDEFGSSSGGDGASAVPEPSTLGLLGLLLLGLALGWMRRKKGGQIMQHTSLLAMAVSLSIAASALASSTNDRFYRLGDDPAEGASAGGSVSLTLDGMFTIPGFGGDQQNLITFGTNPSYADVGPSGLGRPGASSGELGVQFDGLSMEYLEGDRLGLPETSIASTVQGGPLDYTGIANRGFQLWIYPTVGASSEDQHIVMDTLQHGVGIAADGNWFMQYAGAARASSVAVATDQWYHVMVVRPFGASGGSRMYVDGVAVVATGGGYTGTDETVLTLGANTGDNFDTIPGLSNFFTGTLDNLEMFVLGTSTDTSTDWGTFNLGEDNDFIAAQGLVDGDLTGDGQVLGDGSGGANDDVAVFVDNWKAENLLAGVRVGDLVSRDAGDFNYDGITDLLDWHVLRINHENPANIPSLGSLLAGVPEPTTIALAALLAACACWRRRKDW